MDVSTISHQSINSIKAPALEKTASSQGAGVRISDKFEKSEPQPAKIVWKNVAKLAVGALVGGGLGVAAGLYTGVSAALAGALAGGSGGAAMGLLTGGYLGDKMGQGDSSKVAGIALVTTFAAGALGLSAGIAAAFVASPAVAVGLGIMGAVGGFGKTLIDLVTASQEKPKPEFA